MILWTSGPVKEASSFFLEDSNLTLPGENAKAQMAVYVWQDNTCSPHDLPCFTSLLVDKLLRCSHIILRQEECWACSEMKGKKIHQRSFMSWLICSGRNQEGTLMNGYWGFGHCVGVKCSLNKRESIWMHFPMI